MTTPVQLSTIFDYETRARETMATVIYDRMFGIHGSPDWLTNTTNVAAFEAIKLKPRVLQDVSQRTLATTWLGQKINLPVMLGPTGAQQRAHPQGELATARAAAAAGTVMALGLPSSCSIEEVAKVATGPL